MAGGRWDEKIYQNGRRALRLHRQIGMVGYKSLEDAQRKFGAAMLEQS